MTATICIFRIGILIFGMAKPIRFPYRSYKSEIKVQGIYFYIDMSIRVPRKKFRQGQGRVSEPKISKIAKIAISWFGVRRGPLLVEKLTSSLCCAQCCKEYMACRDGLAFRGFSRSNIILGPGRIEAAQ